MVQSLEDARKIAHGTYDDVIVVEHRGAQPRLQVVLEMPEGSRIVDTAGEYEIDGVVDTTAPVVGRSYRLNVTPVSAADVRGTEATPSSALRYETLTR